LASRRSRFRRANDGGDPLASSGTTSPREGRPPSFRAGYPGVVPAPFVRRARAGAKHRNEKGASLEASVHSILMATLQRIRRRRRSAYSSGDTKFENLQLAMLDLEANNPAFAPVAATRLTHEASHSTGPPGGQAVERRARSFLSEHKPGPAARVGHVRSGLWSAPAAPGQAVAAMTASARRILRSTFANSGTQGYY